MGLLQKAVETYDIMENSSIVGVYKNDRPPLAPVSHIVTTAKIQIMLDSDGSFIDARKVDKSEPKIIIPVTEESAGRTRSPVAHPLCEQIGYLSGKDEKRFGLYTDQLRAWAESEFSHPMLRPILTYVEKRTIIDDLGSCGIDHPAEKDLVRWVVNGVGDIAECWVDRRLFQAYTDWYDSIRDKSGDGIDICMITGDIVPVAVQHPKGIVAKNGNAKLISSNDETYFTFRGRFIDDRQAVTIGYEASQKAHCVLRWLTSSQGVIIGQGSAGRSDDEAASEVPSRENNEGRTFLCWSPRGKHVISATRPVALPGRARLDLNGYRAELKKTLDGFGDQLPDNDDVIVAAFDAATTGRLAVTYYRELQGSDFRDRIYDWDSTCCWWGWNKITERYDAVTSPSLWNIVNCAFGTERGGELETDDRIMGQQMQRLFRCRIDGAALPEDIKRILVERASKPQSYEKKTYENILRTACAVIKKYYYDHKKEDLEMSLDKDKMDRSYQFGRLLAVMEKVERDTYDNNEKRETNAERYWEIYCRRPLHTYDNLKKRVQPYFKRLSEGQRVRYRELTDEILKKISDVYDGEKTSAAYEKWLDRPLDDTYIMGYHLQRRELYRKNDKENINDQEEK